MSFKAKTVLNKDIRVFKQDIDTMEDGLEAIKKFIKEKYDIQGGFTIQYEDEEKDVITIASSEDLEEAYHQAEASGNVLKLLVVPDNSNAPVFEFTSELDKSAINEPKQQDVPVNNGNNNESSSDEQEEESDEEEIENPCYIGKKLLKDLIENKEFRKDFINFIQEFIKILKQQDPNNNNKNYNDIFIQTLSNYKNLIQHPSIKKLSELFPFLFHHIEPFLFLIHTIDVEQISVWLNDMIELLSKFDFNNHSSSSWLYNIFPMIFGGHHGGYYGSPFYMPPPPPPPPPFWYGHGFGYGNNCHSQGQGQGSEQEHCKCCSHNHGRYNMPPSPPPAHYSPFGPFGNFFMPPPPPPHAFPFGFGPFGHPHHGHHGHGHGHRHGFKHGHHGRFGKGHCRRFEQMFNCNNSNSENKSQQENQSENKEQIKSPWCNLQQNKCEWKKWCKWNKKCNYKQHNQESQENTEYSIEILNDNVTLMDKAFVLPGQVIIKTWHVKNNGKKDWPNGMKLKYYGKLFNPIINGIEFNVPELKINEEGDLSVIIETPKLEDNIFGKQKAFFRLHLPNNNGIIGPIFRVRVNIVNNGVDNNNNNNIVEEKKDSDHEESDVIEQLKQVHEHEPVINNQEKEKDNNNSMKMESSPSSFADINIPKIEDFDVDVNEDNEMMPEPVIPIKKIIIEEPLKPEIVSKPIQVIEPPKSDPIMVSNINDNNNNNNNYVYEKELNMLLNMGFDNAEKIRHLLNVHHGDVNVVINQLFA